MRIWNKQALHHVRIFSSYSRCRANSVVFFPGLTYRQNLRYANALFERIQQGVFNYRRVLHKSEMT